MCFSVSAKERTAGPGPALTHASRSSAEPPRRRPRQVCTRPWQSSFMPISRRCPGTERISRTVPLGWCWGSMCGTWRPLSWLRGALRACGIGVAGGAGLGCGEAVLVYGCLGSHRCAVGDATDGEALPTRPPVLTWETWEATWGLAHRSGSPAARKCWLWKVQVMSPGQGLPEECLFNKYF